MNDTFCQQRLLALLPASSDLVALSDPDGRLLFVNAAGRAMLGIASDAPPVSARACDFLPSAGRDEWVEEVRATAERAGIWRGEATLLRADGGEVPVCQMIQYHPGDALGGPSFSVTARDISAQRASDASLIESNARLKRAQQLARLGFIDWHIPTDDVLLSCEALRMLGLPEEQYHTNRAGIVGRVHPEDTERVEAALAAAVTQDAPYDLEHRMLTADGGVLHIRAQGEFFRDASGAPRRLLGTMLDIGAHRAAIETLRSSEARYRRLFDCAADGLAVLDGASRFIEVNPSVCEILGRTQEELKAISAGELIHPDDLAAKDHAGAVDALMRGESILSGYRLRHREGHFISCELRTSMLGPDRFLNVIRDVSERRQLEEQLQSARRLEAVGRLAGGIAHDFNNLLSAILGGAELLGQQVLPNSVAAADVADITKAARRAAELTAQLLAFARRQTLAPKALSVGRVIGDVEPLLRRVVGAHIAVSIQVDESAGTVWVDQSEFERVLVNLVVNARDAMPDGGHLTIAASAERLEAPRELTTGTLPAGCWVTISVSDTGQGISDAALPQIFEPFFTTKENGRGTGLGLASAHGFVRQSGGFIDVQTARGEGSTFRVYLPISREAPLPVAEGSASVGGGSETVLLVEDEPVVRRMTQRLLSAKGYVVLAAASGPDALALAMAEPRPAIDLLLTDLSMPGMSGLSLASTLRALRPRLKVLLMSGYLGAREDPSQGLSASYIGKPFTSEALLRAVRGSLDS